MLTLAAHISADEQSSTQKDAKLYDRPALAWFHLLSYHWSVAVGRRGLVKARAPGGVSKLCCCFRPAHFSRLLGHVDAGLVFKREEEQEVVQVMDAHGTRYHLYNIMQSVRQTACNKQCVREGFKVQLLLRH